MCCSLQLPQAVILKDFSGPKPLEVPSSPSHVVLPGNILFPHFCSGEEPVVRGCGVVLECTNEQDSLGWHLRGEGC